MICVQTDSFSVSCFQICFDSCAPQMRWLAQHLQKNDAIAVDRLGLVQVRFVQPLQPLYTIQPMSLLASAPEHRAEGVMQGCAWGLFSRDRGETESMKPETEAKMRRWQFKPRRDRDQGLQSSRPRRSRPRRTNSEARPSRVTTAPRDGLETEVSTPRPHPTSISFRRLM